MESWAVTIIMEEIGKAIGKGAYKGSYADDPVRIAERIVEFMPSDWIDDSNLAAIQRGIDSVLGNWPDVEIEG